MKTNHLAVWILWNTLHILTESQLAQNFLTMFLQGRGNVITNWQNIPLTLQHFTNTNTSTNTLQASCDDIAFLLYPRKNKLHSPVEGNLTESKADSHGHTWGNGASSMLLSVLASDTADGGAGLACRVGTPFPTSETGATLFRGAKGWDVHQRGNNVQFLKKQHKVSFLSANNRLVKHRFNIELFKGKSIIQCPDSALLSPTTIWHSLSWKVNKLNKQMLVQTHLQAGEQINNPNKLPNTYNRTEGACLDLLH